MPDALCIEGFSRDSSTNPVDQILTSGNIPFVLYGGSLDSNLLGFIDSRLLDKIVNDPSGMMKIYSLSLGGKSFDVIFRDVQYHPLTDLPVHFDLMIVDQSVRVYFKVPVRVIGKVSCPAMRKGGFIRVVNYTTRIKGSPFKIPSSIDIDISSSDIGSRFYISDISLDKSLSFRNDDLLVEIKGKTSSDKNTVESEAPSEEPAAS